MRCVLPSLQRLEARRRRLMGAFRIEIEGPDDHDTPPLQRMGCMTEIVSWRTRLFSPDRATLERILDRWPVAPAPV